ncbi:hypothetical protein HID58_075539 [Brassica napus]|uniref:DUF569 domain-containing protein n=3 Tax=Brassica TaxID=3705 RepID=A0ABQ7YJZ2_BRANA|nr:uncharacterized protein LOC106370113 [Brassica napus]KAH0868517.1 hypothetical protein HID58_075539 [Brassica napus]
MSFRPLIYITNLEDVLILIPLLPFHFISLLQTSKEMELFSKGNAVKLLSHHNMFLLADEDQKTIRQSRKRCSRLAIWTVETVIGKPKLIRLRSCHGTYLTASSKPFLLGTTGERVTQTQSFNNPMDCQTHWEPEGYGASVKLKSWCGKWMRANGGAPPWRKSVTHDEPPMSKTKNWLLWYVITVDGFDLENVSDGFKSSLSSPLSPHLPGLGFWSAPGSPVSGRPKKSLGRFASLGLRSTSPRWSPKLNMKQKEKTCSFDETETVSAVEFFRKAKAVRMCSSHNKYLTADENEETVSQGKNGSTENAQWTVELVSHSYHVIRLKSCYGKYLTASNERFILGVTGKKVMQLKPSRLDSSVEWEPVREGSKILLKTTYGNYLRANDGPPPRRKSVTHDNPRSATLESISWEVDVVEILINPQLMEEMEFTPSPRKSVTPAPHRKPSNFRLSVSHSMTPSSFSYISNSESDESPSKVDGRVINYHINPLSKAAEMKYTPSSKKTLPSPPHRKPSWNPFSLSDKSDSDSDESLPKSNELTNNYHIDHPKSTPSSKRTMHPTPHRKLSNSLHSKTLSSLLNIPESDFESPSKSDGRTLDYKAEKKFISSSKKMLHPTPHKMPSNFTHSKTLSSVSDKSDSDCDESPSKSDGRAINYHINPPFKAAMKYTLSSKKMLYQPPNRKLSNSSHSKTPSSLSDISDSNFDESSSKPDERTIDYHINKPSKAEMKSKKMSPHRRPSNSSHSKTPSFVFDRSESDSDESPSKSDEQTNVYHINPSFKTEFKSTPSSKKMLHSPSHSKPSNSLHPKTPSSLSDISDSTSDESPSHSDEIGYHINHSFKFEMIKSTSSSKKPSNSHHSKTSSFFDRSDSDSDESPSNSTLPSKKTLHPPPYKKPSNSLHSKTPSSLSDKSDSESDESPSKLDVQTVDYHINPPFKVAMKSSMSSKKILHPPLHKKPASVWTPCSLSDQSDGNSVESPLKPNGRTIYYSIADERRMENKSTAGYFFTFRGNSVAELTQTLREETCLEDVVVCTRNPLSGKLSPLRLQLPPNNGILHLVLLPSSGSLYERREN